MRLTQARTTKTIANGPARALTRRCPRRGRPARQIVAMTFRPSPLRPLGCHRVWKMSRRTARTTTTPTQVMTQPATRPTAGSLPAGPLRREASQRFSHSLSGQVAGVGEPAGGVGAGDGVQYGGDRGVQRLVGARGGRLDQRLDLAEGLLDRGQIRASRPAGTPTGSRR